jgi:3-phosphoshikimate 1-carboxyvinyltransferase
VIRSVPPAVLRGRVRAPPSKSYTHRALVLAALSDRRVVRILGPLDAEDTRATARGLAQLGARLEWGAREVRVHPPPRLAPRRATVECGQSGSTLRFLMPLAALGDRPIRFVGRGRLPERPVDGLVDALRSGGARVRYEKDGRSLPLTVQGPLRPGAFRLRVADSSQPLTALLMALPTLPGDSTLAEEGRAVSRPYVEATRYLLRSAGVRVVRTGRRWRVPGGQRPRWTTWRVPGDASSAAYLWAGAGATGGAVTVTGIPDGPPQADLQILKWLADQGATVTRSRDGVRVAGPVYRGTRADFSDAPDLYPLAAVLAAVTPGATSELRAGPQLRKKESDRLAESPKLAAALGAVVSTRGPWLRIRGAAEASPVRLEALHDHRLVMSATVGALAARGPSRIGPAENVAKSFPGFWTAIDRLRRARRPRRAAPG